MSKKAKGDAISTYWPEQDLRRGAKRRYLTGGSVLYPEFYAWFVFLAALDVMLTWIILYFDGSELNALANWIIDRNGMAGVVCYKFVIVAFVLSMCELIGRRNGGAGRKLAQLSVVITAFPVVLALMELFAAKHSLA